MSQRIVSNWSTAPPAVPWLIITFSLVSLATKLAFAFLTPFEQQLVIDVAGLVPARSALDAGTAAGWLSGHGLTPVTSLLVHADWLHLLGNLAYLWVFGIKVERRLGSVFMVLVFVIGGALANVVVALQLPELATPIIGASGAVSVVVGAYLGLFPTSRIGLFLPLGIYLQFARVPALLVIGSWFTLQLVYSAFGPITGAVAWWTHLAGFVLGLMFAMLARALAQFRF